jgi:hypothetical protein
LGGQAGDRVASVISMPLLMRKLATERLVCGDGRSTSFPREAASPEPSRKKLLVSGYSPSPCAPRT